jgi:hypothetical protein
MTLTWAWGQVQGRVVTVATDLLCGDTLRYRFTIEDSIFNERVECCLPPEKRMGDILDKAVLVSGYVGREKESGHARRISRITDVEVLKTPEPGAYKQARGCMGPSDEPPEDAIRRVRDEWAQRIREKLGGAL